jgi:hypothetical protein
MTVIRKLSVGVLLVLTAGCASLEDGYATRVGLTNPDYPLMPPTPTDESYPKGSVGQRYIEEYDKKYHEKEVLSSPEQTAPEEEEQATE